MCHLHIVYQQQCAQATFYTSLIIDIMQIEVLPRFELLFRVLNAHYDTMELWFCSIPSQHRTLFVFKWVWYDHLNNLGEHF